jgi:hypothetical protein
MQADESDVSTKARARAPRQRTRTSLIGEIDGESLERSEHFRCGLSPAVDAQLAEDDT